MHTHNDHHGSSESESDTTKSSNKAFDPVCGMSLALPAKYSLAYREKNFHFCSISCKVKFTADPARYLKPEPQTPEPPAAEKHSETIYTCPMHPEIRQSQPGSCPKCGMTLEPVIPELEEEENPELISFSRRFWWTLPMTIIVTILAMFGHNMNLMDSTTQTWVELLLSLPIVLWAGWPFFSPRSVVHYQ